MARPVINNAAMLLIALFRPEVPETARKNYVNLSKHLRYLISVIVSSELCASKYLRNTLFINAGFILDARRNIILCKTQDVQKAAFCFKITSLLMNRNF